MLTEEQIQKNKVRFLDLVRGIERDGVDMNTLVRQLEESDFFIAPASTVYHCSFRGGLCFHCLNVYDELKKLLTVQYPDVNKTENEEEVTVSTCPYSEDTIRIVSLFHDFSKMNYYETFVKNEKVYSPDGKKFDEMGNFDWVAKQAYKVKDSDNRFLYGNHEMNALYMTQTFFPMSIEEQTAILHHMGGLSNDSAKDDILSIYSKYKLALWLHLADMSATYSSDTKNG